MSLMRSVQAGFIAGLLAVAAVATAEVASPSTVQIDTSSPSKLIESAANALLKGIDQNRAQFRKDPSGLYQLVSDTLLTNFDTEYAAEQVLGAAWKSATPEQRDRFVKAFYHSLLYQYGDNLVGFTADRFKVIHRKVAADAPTAAVKTIIKRSNGQPVEVMFYLRRSGAAWKAYNMAFEGVNYIVTYRQEYGTEVRQKGLEAVIARLEAKAAAAKAGKGQGA